MQERIGQVCLPANCSTNAIFRELGHFANIPDQQLVPRRIPSIDRYSHLKHDLRQFLRAEVNPLAPIYSMQHLRDVLAALVWRQVAPEPASLLTLNATERQPAPPSASSYGTVWAQFL